MEFDYFKYKKITAIKIVFMAIAIAIPILTELILINQYIKTFGDQNSAKICAGVLVVFIEVVCVYKLTRYIKIVLSKEFAEKYYVKIHDEREVFLSRKANAFSTKFALYIIGFCAAVAGCCDAKIFYTLMAVFFFLIIAYCVSYLYYKKKN